MAKRKKRMKFPNNFGNIKYLGKGRRRPYGVYPPVEEWTFSGSVSPKALTYAETLKRSSFKITSSPSLEVIRHTSPPI